MAEKRHYGTMDHLMHNKLSRLELAPQRPTACFGIATSHDLQTSQNFTAYSTPDSEGHGSSSPWSSAAAYLQYAGSALNEHLQAREASVKYQKAQAEQQHNPLHLADNQNNPLSVHQSSIGHSYHMSCPRVRPPIAMPRPVYRSPSNFMDTAYGSRGFQSLGVCLASQPLCPPAVEWNSPARFTHSSSPLYVSGTKKHLSTPSTYLEVAGSPSTLSQSLQEQNPIYRHRADMSLAVGVSSTCSQKDIFTDTCHSVAQQNVQLLYAEGNVPLGRQRTSAFTTPSPQHNNSKPSLDHRVGHLYAKNLYNNTNNSIHQRSSPFSCSIDVTGSPHSVRGSSVYPNRAQHMQHSAYVNADLRVQTSHLDGTLQPSERPLQVNPSTHNTSTEIPVSSPQRDRNLWVQSGQMSRDICGTSSRTDKEMLFDSTPTNRSLQERTAYQDSFTGQSAQASFVQQSSSSVITPVVSSHELYSGQHVSRHSVTLEASSLHSSIYSFADRRVTGVRTVENTSTSHSSRSHLNLDHAVSTVPSPSSVSQVDSQYQMNHHNYDPKTAPTAVSEDVNIDNPKSPPMPVINDVFSLAPYRAYLEGKAPHPFPTHEESEVENISSTSTFLEVPHSKDRTEKSEGISNITKVINDENVTIQSGKCVQTGEQDISMQNTGVESVVLDLSLKKLPQTGSSPCVQKDFSCHDKDTVLTVDAENCMDKAGKQIQSEENNMSSDSSRIVHFGQERVSAQASSMMGKLSQEKCPPLTINSVSSSDQKNIPSNENLLCQRQKNIMSQMPKAIPWQRQENWQSQATEQQKNNLEESSLSLDKLLLVSQHQEGDYSRDTERLPGQHKKSSPSQVIERLQQKLQKNNPSRDYKNKSHNHYKSHSSRNLSQQPRDNYSCQAPESLPQLSSTTSQTLKTSVQHPNHSDISVFVNTMQTQTTVLPVILASPPTVYFTNTLEVHTSQPPSRPRQIAKTNLKSCHTLSSPSGSENESNGFHSSKSFMFRKYKMQKFSSSEEETRKGRTDPPTQNVSSPFLSDTVQSLPPSAPESSPVLGEANVSLASVGEPFLSSSGQQFSELHRSVNTAITSSVARSPSSVLEDWLSKTKEEERSKTPVKTKNSFRSNDQSSDLPDHDIWLAFDGVRLLLHKLLSQLETFMFTRRCPFPHVIRAGAIFIPIYLVKEVLFPDLLSPAVDKILQKHKVELRPTTLSEEKFLRETKLKDCSSRMLKLLALKQLPDVYPDLLCLFCRHTIQQELGKSTRSLDKEELKLTDSSEKEPKSASPRKVKSSLILKLQRVRKHSGIHVYKTQNPDTPKKDKLKKSPVCRKKQFRARPVFTYKKKRRRRTSKRFPNLVGRRILHLFDDGEQEVWFPGRVLRVHRRSRKPRDTQFEVWYDEEPGTRYFLELLQDYEKGWLQLVG